MIPHNVFGFTSILLKFWSLESSIAAFSRTQLSYLAKMRVESSLFIASENVHQGSQILVAKILLAI